MTTELRTPDPLESLLRSKGLVLRIVALAASVLAIMLPAGSMTAYGMEVPFGLAGIAPLSFAFPITIVVAVLVSAIIPIRSYARLVDAISVVVGLLVVGFLIWHMVDLAFEVDAVRSADDSHPDFNLFRADYEFGSAFLVIAVLLIGVQSLRRAG